MATSEGRSGRRAPRVWAALGALLLTGAAVGLVVSARTSTVFTATASSYIASPLTGARADLGEQPQSAAAFQPSFSGLATTPVVLGPVIRELGLRTTAARLAKEVTVVRASTDAVLRVQVTDPSAMRAAAIANAVQTELGRQVELLAHSSTRTRLVALDSATVPRQPSSPNVALDLAIGALGGAGLWVLVLVVGALVRLRPPGTGGLTAPSLL